MERDRVRDQPEYVLEDGTFFLKDNYNEVIFGTTEIWMLIDIRDHIIHKHGSKDRIEQQYNIYQTKLRDHAKEQEGEQRKFVLMMADDIVMLNVTKIPLNELNHALASSGYIKRLLKQYGVIEN